VLCSTLIEDVKRRIEALRNPRVVLGYFYFDFQDESKQSTISLIRNLIRQLCSSESRSWKILTALFKKHSDSGQQPSQDDLLNLLVKVIEDSDKTFIMIDALDECTDKEDAADTILELFSRVSAKINILVVSRRDSDIERSLSDIEPRRITKIAAQNLEANKDISEFIRIRMERDRRLRRWKGEVANIVRVLVDQADGM
jgi:ankyrin repeat domain-containing protein 50